MQQAIFSTADKTLIYKSHSNGWQGETMVEALGKTWRITTCKRYNGIISTHCKVVQVSNEDGCEMITISYCMLTEKKANEEFTLNAVKGICTENLIRETHTKSLLEMDAKLIAGELPNADDEYKIEVGQVVFSEGPEGMQFQSIL